MKKLFYLALTILTVTGEVSYADCTFRLVNDSTVPVIAEAGFFNAESGVVFSINQGLAKDVIVKNDGSCNSITKAGLGVTYMNLVNGQSQGGWVYDPANSRIKAVGLRGSATGATGKAPDGRSVTMLTTRYAAADKFIVVVKSDQSSSRQNSSMD